MKFELLMLRRAVWPLRDALNTFLREPGSLIRRETIPYLRDLYDHAIRIIDLIEIYREIGSSLMEFYLSSVSNRLNEVMRVLTIIATIFIPLGFIAGIYGMNFNPAVSPLNMPELNWYFGYPFALGVMFLFTVAQLFFFWRKGWLKPFYRSVESKDRREPPSAISEKKN